MAMSERTALISSRALQKQITRRRLWLVAVTWLFCLLWYPGALATLLAGTTQSAAVEKLSHEQLVRQCLYLVSRRLGLRQSLPVFAVVFGAVIAIQGFSYLFSREKLDFYESQPVSRMRRFWAIFWNGFALFEIPLLVSFLLSALVARAMGAMNGLLLREVGFSFLQLSLLFVSSYALGLLAVMLTGQLITAILMAAVLLSADWIFFRIADRYASLFFRTYYYGARPNMLLSPLYNSDFVNRLYPVNTAENGGMTEDLLRELVSALKVPDLVLLGVMAGALVLAVLLYRVRRAEGAGTAVLYAPARFLVRVGAGAAAGLYAGQLVYSAFGSVSSLSDVVMIFAILAGAVLAAGIAEVIFASDFRKFFQGTWQIALAGVLAVLVFAVFRYDLTGYDRLVPARQSVKSCALYVYSENYPSVTTYDARQLDSEERVLETMSLEDTEAFDQMARDAMAAKREDASGIGDGYEAVIRYQLWSGRTITRSVLIPKGEDPAVMDAVVGTKAYRKVLFPDNWEAQVPADARLVSSNGAEERYGNRSLAEGFAENYRKDLVKYTYSLASGTHPILTVGATGEDGDLDESFPVYAEYTNTIAFLKQNDLYLEPITGEDVRAAAVSYSGDDAYQSTTYDDPDQVQQITAAGVPMTLLGSWKDYADYDFSYSADLYLKNGAGTCSLYFLRDRVPDFVKEDLAGTQS